MRKRFAFVFVLVGIAVSALAQQPAQGPGPGGRGPAPGQTIEKIRQLKPNLHMVTGGGANTLIRVTGEGLIVVDTKNPGDENYRRLMEEIASVSSAPVNTCSIPITIRITSARIRSSSTQGPRSSGSRR